LGSAKENSEIKEAIRRIALINAIAFQGKAQAKPVLGKILSEKPDLKNRIRDIALLVNDVVQEVNRIPLEEQIEIVRRLWPEALIKEKEKIEEKKGLASLPNVKKYGQVITRFAPNPDSMLHLGNARAIVLCDEYAKMYKGSFRLRFEDTDPRLKRSALPFYEGIREDLKWLGCQWDIEVIQSDRLPIYYEHAESLLQKGSAYVCICKPEEFRKRILAKKPCPCRDMPISEHLTRWKRMLNGKYKEGEAVVRIKTDLNHPNPAVRDWPAFRVIDVKKYPHPRAGGKYRVWPLYNFSCGIDDHLMGITHIIRGKEHLTNQRRQEYLYRHFGWEYPEALHYGRLKIAGASLSKSKILRGVQDGTYKSWDDPRLATFIALRKRGMRPEAIRQLIIDIGPRPADITLSWENLYAYNRKIVDSVANRFFFVQQLMKLLVKGVQKEFTAQIPFHPSYPERGFRTLEVKPKNNEAYLLISSKDAALLKRGSIIRLIELFNIQIEDMREDEVIARFHSEPYNEARRLGAPLIHWIPEWQGVPCEVVMPDGSVVSGLAEDTFRDVSLDQIVQFERFGFVRVDEIDHKITVFFAHK